MSKLAIILALLVVLPTALTGLLAGRVLRNWEVVLQGRFEDIAAGASRDASRRLMDALDSDWREVRTAVAGALARRGRLRDIDPVAVELSGADSLVDGVFLFMDPLGFVYPDTNGSDVTALTRALRGQLAASAGSSGAERPLVLRVAGELYCFGALRQGPGLYVGYRVHRGRFRSLLDQACESVSGDDMVLTFEMPDEPRFPVVVSDSFAPSPDAAAVSGDAAPAVFVSALKPPLDFLNVTATWRDPDQAARAAAWQSRLYGWAMALMLACVLTGVWLILRRTGAEVRRLRERGDLAMAMSHDLRTPIASIKMMAESLYLGHVSEQRQQRDFLRTLIAESDRLSDMTERVLFLVRRERRLSRRAMQPLDAAGLALEAVDIYLERATLTESPAAGRIWFSAADNLPPVRADRAALMAVLANLIDNALKHGAPESAGKSAAALAAAWVSVDFVLRRRRPLVRLAVRDFGSGIERGEQSRIFHRFYRGASATAGGSGLGLALCRDIVRAHGGWIELWSEPGRGSEFRIYLRAGKEST